MPNLASWKRARAARLPSVGTYLLSRFYGNGYSDEWVEEAAKRGLDCEKSCPKIFERYLDPASIKMFEDMGVMKKNELEKCPQGSQQDWEWAR